MKVKELGMSIGYTYQPEPYHSIKGEMSVLVTVEEGDDIEVIKQEMESTLHQDLLKNLAGVTVIHGKLSEGYTPEQLITGEDDGEEEWTEY